MLKVHWQKLLTFKGHSCTNWCFRDIHQSAEVGFIKLDSWYYPHTFFIHLMGLRTLKLQALLHYSLTVVPKRFDRTIVLQLYPTM